MKVHHRGKPYGASGKALGAGSGVQAEMRKASQLFDSPVPAKLVFPVALLNDDRGCCRGFAAAVGDGASQRRRTQIIRDDFAAKIPIPNGSGTT
jgi:hypothetical protein